MFELERSPAGLLARAETHVAMGSFGRARDDAREALELDPELGQAWCILGLALFVDKQHARAIPNFNQALACDPQLAQAHYLRAQCFRSEGDLGSALEDFEAFLEFEPDNPAAIFARAEVLKALGRDEESRAQMQRARRLCDDTKLAEVIEERLRAR